jgi:hypothetical protein
LYPHSGHRHTACIRYISAFPQRSQSTASSEQLGAPEAEGAEARASGVADDGVFVSDMAGIIGSVRDASAKQ